MFVKYLVVSAHSGEMGFFVALMNGTTVFLTKIFF